MSDAKAEIIKQEPPKTPERVAWELVQSKASVYSKSTLVPKEYQGSVGNVLIAQNMANRMGADVLMVMQNLYIVHGKPGWSAQFLIACFNQCERFSAIKYRFIGEPGKPSYGCIAYATELATGEVIEGTAITLAMAAAEGWSTKPGSKWKTMPEQMLRYRAATFLIRSTAPEIGMGLMTRDEIEDSYKEQGNRGRAANVMEALNGITESNPMESATPSTQEPEVVLDDAKSVAEHKAAINKATSVSSLSKVAAAIELDASLNSDSRKLLIEEVESNLAELERQPD
jgi:hypothetical protein